VATVASANWSLRTRAKPAETAGPADKVSEPLERWLSG
jgi:hypothetical protein